MPREKERKREALGDIGSRFVLHDYLLIVDDMFFVYELLVWFSFVRVLF